MLKLFYSPGACSIVSHIALEEAGADFERVRVMLAQGEQLKPEYLAVNPHGRVPALATDEGVITEQIAVVNYIADRFGGDGSVPRGDAFAAAKCNELLGWFASTVHIAFAEVFRPGRFVTDESAHEVVTEGGRAALLKHFDEIEGLCGDGWTTGARFTAADSYLLIFFRWAKRMEFEMTRYPRWAALVERVLDRPAVARTLEAEGWQRSDFTISWRG
jgi:glutathione S-transferase